MNKGGNFLRIHDKSLGLYPIKRLTSCIRITVRSYGHSDDKEHSQRKGEGHHEQGRAERAPSTAEEFERVAEEKSQQGFASPTVEKPEDGSQGATMLDSTSESEEESFKEPPIVGNYHKTGYESRPHK